MNIDGPIKTFAEFNNENCRNGYLYFNQKDDLRISVMPAKRSLDTPWPLQKIPFKQTGRFPPLSLSLFIFHDHPILSSTFPLLSRGKQSKLIHFSEYSIVLFAFLSYTQQRLVIVNPPIR